MKRTPEYMPTDAGERVGQLVEIRGFRGVACRVVREQTEPDEDTEWSGYEVSTGRLLVRMVGDDTLHPIWPDEIVRQIKHSVCSCGQLGCDDGEPDE